jgi:hypothetical protein
MKLRADKTLATAAKTFLKKNKKYGDNWVTVGRVFAALYPNGITLKTEYDFILFHWMSWKIGKMTRFVNTGHTHQDSIHDDGVYTFMIETLITTQKGKTDAQHKSKRVRRVS